MIASFLAIPIHAETLNASDVYYVTDNANVLSQSTVEKIKNFNGALEQQCSGAQVVVATVKYTGGFSSDEYAMKLFNSWGIGSSDYNNGILILLVTEENKFIAGILILLVTEENKYYIQCGLGIDVDSLADSLGDDLNKFENYFDAGKYDQAVNTVFDGILEWFDTQYTANVSHADQYITNSDSYGEYGSSVDLFSLIFTLIFLYVFFHAIVRSIRRTHYIRTGTWLPYFLFFGPRRPYWGYQGHGGGGFGGGGFGRR